MNMKMALTTRVSSLLFALVIVSGCHGTKTIPTLFSSDRDTAVYVLFDISGSTSSPNIRQGYRRDLNTIETQMALRGGNLRGDVIGSEALNNSTIPINVAFPSYNAVLSTEDEHKKEVSAASDLLHQQVEKTLDNGTPSSQTAIMASLEVAAKVLNGDQLGGAKQKALVIFSDMLEESPRYRFPKEHLTDTRIRAIVEAERIGGRLPNLQGVKVWKTGASAEHLDDDRSRDLQHFWSEYFKASGASLESDHYGSTLLNFSLE
jgi:hypothetical protein